MKHVKKITSRKDVLVFLLLICMILLASVAMLSYVFFSDRFHVRTTVSEVFSNSIIWENKKVEVEGIIQRTALGIIYPFNYWLFDKENQTIRVGVKWHSYEDLSGKNVFVIGFVRKGYAWVHPNYPGWWIYFIEARIVYKTS